MTIKITEITSLEEFDSIPRKQTEMGKYLAEKYDPRKAFLESKLLGTSDDELLEIIADTFHTKYADKVSDNGDDDRQWLIGCFDTAELAQAVLDALKTNGVL